MASSLEKLVRATDKANFKLTKSAFGDKADALLLKGVYPYEYSLHKFNESQLPPIDKFYSKLTYEKKNKGADYTHAQQVWNEFNCKNLGD